MCTQGKCVHMCLYKRLTGRTGMWSKQRSFQLSTSVNICLHLSGLKATGNQMGWAQTPGPAVRWGALSCLQSRQEEAEPWRQQAAQARWAGEGKRLPEQGGFGIFRFASVYPVRHPLRGFCQALVNLTQCLW